MTLGFGMLVRYVFVLTFIRKLVLCELIFLFSAPR